MGILLFLIILISSVFSFENDLSLRLGGHVSSMNIQSFDDVEGTFIGGGFNSNISWRFTSSEWGFVSFAFLGGGRANLNVASTQVVGRSKLRRVAIGPFYKYITPLKVKNWHFFTALGPVWSMETFKFSSYSTLSGNFPAGYKMALVSRGAFISLGMEELFKSKKKNNSIYFEIRYGFSEAIRAFLVDATDFKSVITLNKEKNRQHVKIHTIALNMGVMLF